MTPKALIFDLDGTLVHTDDHHFQAYAELLSPHDITLERPFYDVHMSGRPNMEILNDLLPDLADADKRHLVEQKEARFQALAQHLEPIPGLHDLLAWADRHALARAVVTSAPADNADFMLGAIGLKGAFPVLVIAAELARGKPDPLPYQVGLERLGVDAAHAVAFEDSLAGVRSARGAGLATVGVATTQTAADLQDAGASIVVADFTSATLWPFLQETLALTENA